MEDDDRLIIIGVTDVDEEMKQRRAAERVKEEHLAYSRLNALAGDFVSVYVVDPETEHFREFSSTDYYKTFELPEEGEDFFAVSRQRIDRVIFPDDHQRFLSMFNRREVMEEIEKNGIFALTYRLMIDGKPTYVQLKATIVEEQTGKQMIVGINIIDSFVRQEEEYAKRLAQAQSKANIDALTGVKNKHAYLDEEERLDQMIGKHQASAFAIVVMDLNDLKKVNDTQGHQAGDQYICDACKYICDTFKKSPVFRVGGDEFAVIAQGDDYTQISGLLARVEAHNEEAVRNGGMIIACGYASYENDRCVAEVFERADTLMYENKNVLKKRQEENG
ncbi:MAG: GGDEF domain-containing protein [Lachnospiraceae bacterium]|nr:GGDEF domain-containing protein [Lachnospiraceae bacterium]